MRRALVLVGLIGLGVLLGFLIRLVWPRRRPRAGGEYQPVPASPLVD
jgi:hypothetical protein